MVKLITAIAALALLVAICHGQRWNGRSGFGSDRWNGGVSDRWSGGQTGIGWGSNWNGGRGFGSRGWGRDDGSNFGSGRSVDRQLSDLELGNRIGRLRTDVLLDRLDNRNGDISSRARIFRWAGLDEGRSSGGFDGGRFSDRGGGRF